MSWSRRRNGIFIRLGVQNEGRSGIGWVGAKGRDRRPVLESREVPLIENSVFRDNSALGGRIVEFPALVVRRVAYEDALLHVRAKLSSFILLNMHIGQASPNPKIGEVRLALEPQLKGSSIRSERGRHPVKDVDKRGLGLSPERRS